MSFDAMSMVRFAASRAIAPGGGVHPAYLRPVSWRAMTRRWISLVPS